MIRRIGVIWPTVLIFFGLKMIGLPIPWWIVFLPPIFFVLILVGLVLSYPLYYRRAQRRHVWMHRYQGGDPTEVHSREAVSFCYVCGTEQTDGNTWERCR